MVQAKPELKARARELRRAGRTYDEIVTELGVAKSSVSLWVRDLPKPRRSTEHARMMAEARWGPFRRERDLARKQVITEAAQELGRLTERDLFVLGVGLYWAEGSKRKSHDPKEKVTFINSDPDMIRVYLAWLDLLGVAADRRRFSLMIHESADVESAERYWADLVGQDVTEFGKTTLKRHNPKTVRKNTGPDYRGCLVVRVLQGADLYRRIEGWWSSVAAQCGPAESPALSGRV
jgi:transcriptional regulator with XRE-family HTH domain